MRERRRSKPGATPTPSRPARGAPGTTALDALLAGQRARFRVRFSREMTPDDPLFFDEEARGSKPRPIDLGELEKALLTAMKASGARPELIHAFEKTGLIVSEDNLHLLTKAQLREWDAAIADYHARRRGAR